MKLLIISHTPHYYKESQIVGWGPTVKEIDQLAKLFSQIRHVSFLYETEAPLSALPYSAENVEIIPVYPSGGDTFMAKLAVLKACLGYWKVIRKEILLLGQGDVVHVRCPANVSLIALVLLMITARAPHRWIKYAGNWKPETGDPLTYSLQRWILQNNLLRGLVTINGSWPAQPEHVFSFLNPSHNIVELDTPFVERRLIPPYKFLFIGRVETFKGVGRLLEIAKILKGREIPFEIDIIGDGPERSVFEKSIADTDIRDQINFHGWLAKSSLKKYYCNAHFLILPTSASEGWPKVLSEAMAYGTIPLAGAISSIPQILREYEVGMVLNPLDIKGFSDAICSYIVDPERWERESKTARKVAHQFTYEGYLEHLKIIFTEKWHIILR